MSASIPPEIISDILVRQPVKPLLRFRTVSKPWCALIDSPDFIKCHLRRSIDTKSNRSLYLGGTGTLFSLDYTALQTPIKLENLLKDAGVAHIVGSCNGLLLLHGKDIALFNPATRQYRVLPSTPIEYPKDCHVRSSETKFGFGYDFVNDDYKVIRVVQFKCPGLKWIGSEAKIYSMKTNSWRNVAEFPYCLPLKRVWGVHLNGRLHTVVNTSSDFFLPDIIAAFDLVTEKCHFIPLPDSLDEDYYEITAEVFEGMLCVRATYVGDRTDIWLMRVYEVKELWFKLLSIAPPLVEPYVTIYPLALSSNGQEVLLNFDDKRLIWYDLETKSIWRAPFHGFSFSFYVEVCVDSLVPLDGVEKSVSSKKEVKKVEKPKEDKMKEKKNKKSDDFLSVGFKLKL